MRGEATPIPFNEFVQQLGTIFDESEAQGSARVLVEREGAVFSVQTARRRRAPGAAGTSSQRTPAHYSLLDLIGVGASAEPTDIGRYKHDYLAAAAADTHDTPAEPQAHPGNAAGDEAGQAPNKHR